MTCSQPGSPSCSCSPSTPCSHGGCGHTAEHGSGSSKDCASEGAGSPPSIAPADPTWTSTEGSSSETMPPATTAPTNGSLEKKIRAEATAMTERVMEAYRNGPSPSPPGASSRTRNETQLNEKIRTFDEWAPSAVEWLIAWLRENPEEILHVARARLVTGHYVHGDSEMYEYDQGRLEKEMLEELADAVNYGHLFMERRA
jgi:hypothetical protein